MGLGATSGLPDSVSVGPGVLVTFQKAVYTDEDDASYLLPWWHCRQLHEERLTRVFQSAFLQDFSEP